MSPGRDGQMGDATWRRVASRRAAPRPTAAVHTTLDRKSEQDDLRAIKIGN